MAPRTDRTTRVLSGVASPVTTNHAAKGSVFVKRQQLKNWPTLGRCAPSPPACPGFRVLV